MHKPLISLTLAAAIGLGAAAFASSVHASQETPLIPRDVLFGNPDHAAVRVSPDGKYLSWAAPVDGVLNLWVAPIDSPDEAKAITADKGRGITQYFWAYDNQHVLYLQDKGGNENFNLYSVDLESGETRPLYENGEVRVEVQGVSEKRPDTILVAVNDRMPAFHDVYELNIATGDKKLVVQHHERFLKDVAVGVRELEGERHGLSLSQVGTRDG